MLFTYFLIPLLFLFSPEKEKAPPGTVLVGNYYVDYQEITNVNWVEFEYAIGTVAANDRTTTPKANPTYKHPDNRDLPLTSITYKQAQMYCKWRSKVVSKAEKRKITYRLPTQEEWIEIAEELVKSQPMEIIGEFNEAKSKLPHPKALFISSRNEYPTQLFYNVSEMTATGGVAMGLNNGILKGAKWQDNLSQTYTYDEYSEFVGFRCIAEVEEKKAKKRK